MRGGLALEMLAAAFATSHRKLAALETEFSRYRGALQ